MSPARAEASSKPTFVPARDWAVAVCETQGNWQHRAGRFEGCVGVVPRHVLLDRVSGSPRHAYAASPWQQYRTYLRSLERGRYFGCRVILRQA